MDNFSTIFEQLPEVLDSADLARLMGTSRGTAIKMMSQPGFPLLVQQRRNRRVNKYQLRSWMRGHHQPDRQSDREGPAVLCQARLRRRRVMKPLRDRPLDYSPVRRMLTERGVPVAQVSYLSGYSPSLINTALRTGKPLPGPVLAAIAQLLRLSPEQIASDLLGITVPQHEPNADEVLAALREVLNKGGERHAESNRF